MSEVHSLLPHRKPFLFLDTVEVESAQHPIRGRYRFTDDEPFFRGHFPKYPVVPGVILVETMAQCGGAGLCKLGLNPPGSIFLLATVAQAKFRRPVRPGDEVRLEVVNLRISPRIIRQRGTCHIGDELVAEAEWVCVANAAPPL